MIRLIDVQKIGDVKFKKCATALVIKYLFSTDEGVFSWIQGRDYFTISGERVSFSGNTLASAKKAVFNYVK